MSLHISRRMILASGIIILICIGAWTSFYKPTDKQYLGSGRSHYQVNNHNVFHTDRSEQKSQSASVVDRRKIISHNDRVTYDATFWTYVRKQATREHLYSHDTDVDRVLLALSSAAIVKVRLFSPSDVSASDGFHDYGSTHKWIIDLEGGQTAIFKPKWYTRNHTMEFWSDGFELHTSEIASFHIDRILGFRRVPYTTGRMIDMAREVLPYSTEALRAHITRNDHEFCLRDRCYFCHDDVITCTSDGLLEGSMTYYVPDVGRYQDNPWGVKYTHKHATKGFNNRKHCEDVISGNKYLANEEMFLDLVDLSVLDHLSYHFDSKLYWIQAGEPEGLMVYLDRGRALTQFAAVDSRNLLPLWQCCRVRRNTWNTLTFLKRNYHLTSLLKSALSRDQLHPPSLLVDGHYKAIRHRLRHVLSVIDKCIKANEITNVLL